MAEILFLAVFFVIAIVASGMYISSINPPSNTEKLGQAAPAIINQWAKENGYQVRVTERKTRYVGRFPNRLTGRSYQQGVFAYLGPFLGTVSNGQHVYRVVVTKLGEEKRRVAWIRLGRDMWGITPEAEDFKVIWEDEWRPPEPPAT